MNDGALKAPLIVVAEDDEEDYMLVRDALQRSSLRHELRWVRDGQDLMNYLRREGKYAVAGVAPRPRIILLDLRMPRMDGLSALLEIKADQKLRAIPVVILTSSQADEDMLRAYDLGASGYVAKPVSFEQLVTTLMAVVRYWFETVAAPSATEPRS